jgi:hypothetical protein
MFVSYNSNMTGVTYGTGTAYRSGAPQCKGETIKRGMRFLKFHRLKCLERKYAYKSDPSVFNEEFGVI